MIDKPMHVYKTFYTSSRELENIHFALHQARKSVLHAHPLSLSGRHNLQNQVAYKMPEHLG